MSATYNDDLSTAKDQLRLLIDDRDVDSSPKFSDEELQWFINNNSNVYHAAAAAANQMAARYAGRADKAVGPLRISYSNLQKQWSDFAASLTSKGGRSRGFRVISTGGAHPRNFSIGMHDTPPSSLMSLTQEFPV